MNHQIEPTSYVEQGRAPQERRGRHGGKKGQIRCFKCGCFGHDGKTCEKDKNSQANEEKCWVCGVLGHHAKNCKSKEVTCFSCGEKGHKQAACKSKMANCWNCGQPGHIKRECPVKQNLGMCFNCMVVGHHSNACPNRECHNCGEKGHLKNDCPKRSADRGHMTDSELQPGRARHRNYAHGSLSADEFDKLASNPRSRGFNNNYGFIMPPTPTNQQAGAPYQYNQQYGQAMWNQHGVMAPSTPTGYYQQQQYAQNLQNWQQAGGMQYQQQAYAQTNLPNGVPVQTGRRVSRPVFDDSQSESSFTSGIRNNQFSVNREIHNDLMSISGSRAGSVAGSVADDERTDNEDELPSAVPQTLRMNTKIVRGKSQEHKFSPSAAEFKPRKLGFQSMSRTSQPVPPARLARRKGQASQGPSKGNLTRSSNPVLPASLLNRTSAPVPPAQLSTHLEPPRERTVGDQVFARVTGKHWFGTILAKHPDGTFDIEVELKNGTKETLNNVSNSHIVNRESFDNLPPVINDMHMTPSGHDDLKKRAQTSAEKGKESGSENEEEPGRNSTEGEQGPDTMDMCLPDFNGLDDDDEDESNDPLPFQETPKNVPQDEEEKIEQDDDGAIFTFDEDEFSRYNLQESPLGGLVSEVTMRNMFGGETWQEVCRRSVEWVFETQRRHCLKNGIKWDKSKAKRRSIGLFASIFKKEVLPSVKFLRYARRSQDYDSVQPLSFFDTGFVSTQVTQDTQYNPGRPFGFFILCRFNAVNISYDTRICEGVNKEKYIVQEPQQRDTPVFINTMEDMWEELPKFLAKLINSYLIRGIPKPDVFLDNALPSYVHTIFNNTKTICSQIFGRQLNKEIEESTVISIMEALVRISGSVSSGNIAQSAVIRNEAQIREKHSDGSQPNFSKSSRLIALKALNNINWENLLEREFKLRKSDEVSIIFTDNMKKVFRFSDPERQSIRNLNVQGQNPGCNMTLESYELASFVEIMLPRFETQDEFLYACKHAVLLAKTINLLEIPSWPDTTAKLKNNSRTGIGLSGITMFLAKHQNDYNLLRTTCQMGYKLISNRNKIFAQEFKTAESITKTAVNFQGDLALLTGIPPGMVYFFSRYSLRHVPITFDQVQEYTRRGLECYTKVEDRAEFKFGAGPLGVDVALDGKIRSVNEGSQAAVCGVQAGWVLTEVNRDRFSMDSLKELLQRANATNGTYVLKFRLPFVRNQCMVKIPVDAGEYCSRSCFDVLCNEQLQLCVFLNEFWSDNAVNAPIPFNEETEFANLPMQLRTNQFKLKSVKFWRHKGRGHAEQDDTYTPLDQKTYAERMALIN